LDPEFGRMLLTWSNRQQHALMKRKRKKNCTRLQKLKQWKLFVDGTSKPELSTQLPKTSGDGSLAGFC
jgi:hypothetical protein